MAMKQFSYRRVGTAILGFGLISLALFGHGKVHADTVEAASSAASQVGDSSLVFEVVDAQLLRAAAPSRGQGSVSVVVSFDASASVPASARSVMLDYLEWSLGRQMAEILDGGDDLRVAEARLRVTGTGSASATAGAASVELQLYLAFKDRSTGTHPNDLWTGTRIEIGPDASEAEILEALLGAVASLVRGGPARPVRVLRGPGTTCIRAGDELLVLAQGWALEGRSVAPEGFLATHIHGTDFHDGQSDWFVASGTLPGGEEAWHFHRADPLEQRGLVRVDGILGDAIVDLPYATPDNFVGVTLYPPTAACYLSPPAADALLDVAAEVSAADVRLYLWDCYRPLSVQREMAELVNNPRYVARPSGRCSAHNRADAVDLTLASADGHPVEMPTGFDDISPPAAANAQVHVSPTARVNRTQLQTAMTGGGFSTIRSEWWHFQLPYDESRPPRDDRFPEGETACSRWSDALPATGRGQLAPGGGALDEWIGALRACDFEQYADAYDADSFVGFRQGDAALEIHDIDAWLGDMAGTMRLCRAGQAAIHPELLRTDDSDGASVVAVIEIEVARSGGSETSLVSVVFDRANQRIVRETVYPARRRTRP